MDNCKTTDGPCVDRAISIPQNMQFLADQIGLVQSNVDKLEAKLNDVLRNEPNRAEQDTCKESEPCPHAQKLCDYGQTLIDVNLRLEGIMRRMEL